MGRHHQKLNHRKWAEVRLRVLDRDNWRCRVCGKYGNEVDHVTPLDRGGAAYDEVNLQTLCGGIGGCHAAKTRGENSLPRSAAELEWDIYVEELQHG